MVELSIHSTGQAKYKFLALDAVLLGSETEAANPKNIKYVAVNQKTGERVLQRMIVEYLNELLGEFAYSYDGGMLVLVSPLAKNFKGSVQTTFEIGRERVDSIELTVRPGSDQGPAHLEEFALRLQAILLSASESHAKSNGGYFTKRCATPVTNHAKTQNIPLAKIVNGTLIPEKPSVKRDLDKLKPIVAVRSFSPNVSIMLDKTQKVDPDMTVDQLIQSKSVKLYLNILPKTQAYLPDNLPLLQFLESDCGLCRTSGAKDSASIKLLDPSIKELLQGMSFKRDGSRYPADTKCTLSEEIIDGVFGKSASSYTFDFEGKSISIQGYFKNKYNITLRYPEAPLIIMKRSGRQEYVPAELVILTPQSMNTFGTAIQSYFTEISRIPPMKCASLSLAYADALFSPGQIAHDILHKWGLVRAEGPKSLVSLPSLLIPAPGISYGGSRQINPTNGRWNLTNGVKLSEVNTRKLAVLCVDFFSRDMKDTSFKTFGGEMSRVCSSIGMPMTLQPLKACNLKGFNLQRFLEEVRKNPTGGDRIRIRTDMLAAVTQGIAALLPAGTSFEGTDADKATLKKYLKGALVVLPGGNPVASKFIHITLKDYFEGSYGVATQMCLQSSTPGLNGRDVDSGRLAQHYSAILQGLNTKMTGKNQVVHIDLLKNFMNRGTMIMGGDLQHKRLAMDRGTEVSICGLVGSFDNHLCTYNHAASVQPKLHDIMEDVDGMMVKLLEGRSGIIDNLIYFRDGVDQGSVKEFLLKEVAPIEKAITAFNKGKKPKISVVLCLKRHSVRILPTKTAPDNSDNPPAGTVTGLGNIQLSNEYNNFFMLPHKAIPGSTAKPLKVSVVRNEHGFSPEQWAEITFGFCFQDQVVTLSVSSPAAAMYAHKLCERIGDLAEDHIALSTQGTSYERVIKVIEEHADNMPAHGYL